MRRATVGHPLNELDKLRNRLISRLRSPGERPFAISLTSASESFDDSRNIIKRVFGAGHVLVTTVARVHVKMVFTAIAYNLFQLRTIGKAFLV